MGEIIRFQPNHKWDDSWVLNGPDGAITETAVEDNQDEAPIVVAKEPEKVDWS